jgi:hypothetical protein
MRWTRSQIQVQGGGAKDVTKVTCVFYVESTTSECYSCFVLLWNIASRLETHSYVCSLSKRYYFSLKVSDETELAA